MNIFPTYPNTSGSFVSQRRINKLKPKVIEILQTKQHIILKAFQQLAARYSRPPNIKRTLKKLYKSSKCTSGRIKEMHGESDDYRIWIPKNKANDTLLFVLFTRIINHICTFNGKDICSKDEHYVMRLLGDDC